MVTAGPGDVVAMLVFARVVERQSFTAAAKVLGLSKSGVSERVTALEEQLGARLLQRTTRRLALTPAGMAFYERCARVAAEADEAAAVAAGVGDGRPRGVVRVNAPITFAQMYLASPLARFLRAEPAVRVELSIADRHVDLVSEGVDLAIRIAGATAPLGGASLMARRLTTDRTVCCGSPAYLAERGTPRYPADLVQHTCLRYSQVRAADEWHFRDALGTFAGPGESAVGLAANNGTVLRELALAGAGLAVLPRHMVLAELAQGRLVPILEDAYRSVDLGIFAVHAHGKHPPASLRVLVEHLVAWFKKGLGDPPGS